MPGLDTLMIVRTKSLAWDVTIFSSHLAKPEALVSQASGQIFLWSLGGCLRGYLQLDSKSFENLKFVFNKRVFATKIIFAELRVIKEDEQKSMSLFNIPIEFDINRRRLPTAFLMATNTLLIEIFVPHATTLLPTSHQKYKSSYRIIRPAN